MLALTLPVILLVTVGAIDVSFSVGSKSQLQDATDSASLAVASATAANPNTPEDALRAIAQTTLTSNFKGGAPTLTDFHVCASVQADCTTGSGQQMKTNTVALSASAPTTCTLASLVPSLCGNGQPTVNASTTTTIGLGATMQLNIVMDSSASMIVGATDNDVQLIENWMGYTAPVTTTKTTTLQHKNQSCSGTKTTTNGVTTCTVTTTTTTYPNWNAMKPDDPGPNFSGDNPPCAFACHDVGNSTTSADIQMGLANAKSAGATTRFDVMVSAAQQVLTGLQSATQSNAIYAKNTYLFNVFSFDDSLHTYGSNNMSFAAAQSAVTSVVPGLDTHMSDSLSTLITTVGKNGNGASSATPLKFVILITDGLQSDRNQNWNGTSTGYDSAWSLNGVVFGGYATSISQSQCNQLKSNGVILAVLETPYVPLTGQSPAVMPYEKTVRHVIYPGGPGSASTISAALQQCASTNYYYKAASSTDIQGGLLKLIEQFVAQSSFLSK